jgi:hypothetical protein
MKSLHNFPAWILYGTEDWYFGHFLIFFKEFLILESMAVILITFL